MCTENLVRIRPLTWDIWQNSISLILLVVVVVLVLQFESQYLKNRKRYSSEILYTSRVQ